MERLIAAGADRAARTVRGETPVERLQRLWSIGSEAQVPPTPPELVRTLAPRR
jgi:hypothetical protein